MAADAKSVPFQEAIDFLKGKVNLPTKKWDDLRHAGHVRGFSVAGVTRDDMLADFRSAIERARREGTGLADFRKSFNEIVDRTGWKFFGVGKTDAERRAWRSRIIYTTNMRTSYMAGRYAQMTDPDVVKYRPYWRYRHNHVRYPRPMHVAWDGTVLAWDDPWWKVHFPPNGWGCQCDVIALSKRQLAAEGKTGPDPAPADQSYEGKDPRTGQSETRYPGIDRGWEYNVGAEWQDGLVPRELQKPLAPIGEETAPADLPAMPAPQPAPKEKLLADDLEPEKYVEAFLDEFDVKPDSVGTYRDASGGIVTIGRSMFEQRDQDGTITGLKSGKRDRGRYARLLADAIKDPDEIWADWAKVASGIVLKRSYLKRVTLPDGRSLLVRFEWTSKGWTAVTGFDTTPSYLAAWRRGAMLFQRKE